MILSILACGLFCVGFLVRSNDALMARLGVIEESQTSSGQPSTNASKGIVSNRLGEVEAIINDASMDSYDSADSTLAAIDEFLASTDDPYAHYYDTERYNQYINVNKGQYPGIGVYFSEYKGAAYALDVFEGSSAALAGVKPGDYVVAINGDRTQAWTATEVINATREQEGTEVVVTWRRPSSIEATGGTEFTTSLLCSEFHAANVATEMYGRVGYISLKQITQNADDLVADAISSLSSQGAKSFVLDLRNNAGGYLTEAVDVASLFVKSGVIVEINTRESNTTKQASGSVATDAPLVVLVNENTAGSAEVLAAALRDTSRATLVGTTTMGRGSVQVLKPLSFGGALRYTVARYTSPGGYSIDTVGVTPNISISKDSEIDNQLKLAIETADSLISATS